MNISNYLHLSIDIDMVKWTDLQKQNTQNKIIIFLLKES